MKTALTIAGSDSSGGAGIQADIKTMTMNGVYAMSVITALTAQNTTGVFGIEETTPDFLEKQLDAVFSDIIPDSIKIGMVPNSRQMQVVARSLNKYKGKNIVVDPVMVSTSGARLMKTEATKTLTEEIFPIATLVTPNIPEAEVLWGKNINCKEDMMLSAEEICKRYGCAVLLKGGHNISDADDFLYSKECEKWFSGEMINNPNTHGTGCTLSSAISANLAKGFSVTDAIERAKKYVSDSLSFGLDLGKGSGPLCHNYALLQK